jgi:hypothetical protein
MVHYMQVSTWSVQRILTPPYVYVHTANSSLSYMPMPYSSDNDMDLLSTWPSDMEFKTMRYSPIDCSITQQLRQKDFVGYATNIGALKRNQILSPLPRTHTVASEAPAVDSDVEKAFSMPEPTTPAKKVRPPKKYRVIQVCYDSDLCHELKFDLRS